MYVLLLVLAASTVSACAISSDDDPEVVGAGDAGADAPECDDRDGDGWGQGATCEGDDCDEGNPNRHTGCGEDCDALPEDVGCPCDEPGAVAGCFDGDPELAGEGRCLAGLRTCSQAGLWGSCVGQVLPGEEDPLGKNGIDDDCNGEIDDKLCGDVSDCGGECCTGEEVCYGTYCDLPGDCAVDGNCDDDTHCTPGGCVPYDPGETNPDCDGDIVDPIDPIGEFEPDLQCEWVGDGQLHNVIVPTLVVDLDDTVDEAYQPEIIFSAISNDFANAQIVVIDGATCEERWRSEGAGLEACAPLAVGDVDGDGTIEIAGATSDGGVALFDSEGEMLWRTRGGQQTGCSILTPTLIANLDGVGDAEILLGLVALDSAGDEIWRVDDPRLSPWGIVPVVADVDLDGAQEVVTGNRILSAADGGEEEFFADLDNGLTAIGDFDPSTPEPEIAVIAQSGARIMTISGEVIFGPVPIRGGGGGPPVIADFDGDGEPEFGAAGQSTYVVFDPDCANWARDGLCLSGRDDGISWEKTTQDFSSGATGSSVFDFDFDGVSEVVYNDECFTRVYDGITGESRFVRSNSTGTAYEYPVIADVDGDMQTEIAVSANDFVGGCPDDAETGEPFGQPSVGVKVWRDVQDRWAASRRVWNQHSYSVTNVTERGAIPLRPENNWDLAGLNNFRVNTRDDPGSAERGVDLTVRGEGWDDECPDRIVLRATVANRGIRRAPRGVAVTFSVSTDGGAAVVVCEARTETDIEAGATEAIACEWLLPQVFQASDIHVIVDARVALTECEEENNDSVITAVRCEGID